jgi:hypothetical protein
MGRKRIQSVARPISAFLILLAAGSAKGATAMETKDPMAAVRHYIDAFNRADAKEMAAAFAVPGLILDGMAPHVWQGPTAAQDWYRDVLVEGEHTARPTTSSLWASRCTTTSPAIARTSLFPRP